MKKAVGLRKTEKEKQIKSKINRRGKRKNSSRKHWNWKQEINKENQGKQKLILWKDQCNQ